MSSATTRWARKIQALAQTGLEYSEIIEYMHETREAAELKPYDSVRSMFFDGNNLYDNAGFKEKHHIQICVRTKACIKGCFRVLPEVTSG